jgi:hypothetical protein
VPSFELILALFGYTAVAQLQHPETTAPKLLFPWKKEPFTAPQGETELWHRSYSIAMPRGDSLSNSISAGF